MKKDVGTRLLNLSEPGPNGCRNWKGTINHKGYGQTQVDGRKMGAHRASFEYWVGEIPAGLEIDHLCRNRACIEPTHLEAVTHHENVLRTDTPPGLNSRKTECPQGHPYPPYVPGKERRCRKCHRGMGPCRVCGKAISLRHMARHVKAMHS